MKGNSNINRGLRFSDISNRENSNKDNPRFRNLKVNNKDNLRFNNQDNNLRREFSSRKDKSKDPRFSNHRDKSKDLRLSDHNILSLKENLKERR
jgi:hypothetical protein